MRMPALRMPAVRLSFDWLEGNGRRVLLYGIYTTVLFFVFSLANFPHHAVVQRVLSSLDLKSRGLRLDVSDTRFAWWRGYELQKVRLGPVDPDRPAFLDAGSIFVRPGLDGLMRGRINSVHLAGLMYGGEIDTDLSMADGVRRATVTLDEVQLQRYPLLTELLQDGTATGLLSGVVTVENRDGDDADTRAAGELQLVKAALANVKVGVFSIPELHFDKTALKFSLQGGRLDVQELEAAGPELRLSVSGQIAMREPVADSVLNLKVSALPGPNSPEDVKNLLALLPPPAKGAKPDAPRILSGTLARPRLR
jgi:type II secretion system protein N